jgi:hypothetical protein
MTVLLHKGLEEEQAKMYQDFLVAAGSDAARALCIAPGALHGRRRMKFVAEQRAVQSAEFDIFVEAVTRRIALNAQDLAGAGQSALCCFGRNSWAAGFPLRGRLRTARTFSLNSSGSSRAVACLADT